ncbi:hypothetical protein [Halalkalicoccus tibetensis]|uniref:DUF2975 domain-containing protein n=1 Tax=Halalkalicoccus tibetensis TaxID=175632 RepID=A0ABD5UZ57_9EURY
MSTERRSLLIPGAVYLGAVVLVGVPTMAVLPSLLGHALEALGWDWLSGSVGSTLILGLSVLIGLQLAVEAAALQLGGVAALGRGSPRVMLIRHVALAVSVFAVLAAVLVAAVSAVVGGYGTATVAVGSLVALAAAAALYRGSRAFVAGLRTDD